jgi:hypothetical protein
MVPQYAVDIDPYRRRDLGDIGTFTYSLGIAFRSFIQGQQLKSRGREADPGSRVFQTQRVLRRHRNLPGGLPGTHHQGAEGTG